MVGAVYPSMGAIDLPSVGANMIFCGSTVSKIQQSGEQVITFLPVLVVCDVKACVMQILNSKFWRLSVVQKISSMCRVAA